MSQNLGISQKRNSSKVLSMRCALCSSPRTLRFIDGFGDRRIFCHTCGRSFLENNLIPNDQKSLQEFRIGFYRNVQSVR